MKTINTHEFNGYSLESFTRYLQLQNDSCFLITFPKEAAASEHDHYKIFCQYNLAAYAGSILASAADSFAYYIPSVYKVVHFSFVAEIGNLEKFAGILFPLITAYHEFGSEDDTINFQIAASEFFINAYKEVIEPYTLGLLFITNQFLCFQ